MATKNDTSHSSFKTKIEALKVEAAANSINPARVAALLDELAALSEADNKAMISQTVDNSTDSVPSNAVVKNLSDTFAGITYLECSTPQGTAAKTIANPNFKLTPNCRLVVKMTNSNTVANATLNVNGTGAKPLFYNGERASASNYWEAGEVLDIYYDGNNFQASNFQGGAGEGGNMILTFTTDVATTRKLVKTKLRKAGLAISYKHPESGWITEQFIGTTFTDAEWQKEANWQHIATSKDVTEGIKGTITSDITNDTDKVPSNKAISELLTPFTYKNIYMDTNGVAVANNSFDSTGFLRAIPGMRVKAFSFNHCGILYDKYGAYLRHIPHSSGAYEKTYSEEDLVGAKYIRISTNHDTPGFVFYPDEIDEDFSKTILKELPYEYSIEEKWFGKSGLKIGDPYNGEGGINLSNASGESYKGFATIIERPFVHIIGKNVANSSLVPSFIVVRDGIVVDINTERYFDCITKEGYKYYINLGGEDRLRPLTFSYYDYFDSDQKVNDNEKEELFLADGIKVRNKFKYDTVGYLNSGINASVGEILNYLDINVSSNAVNFGHAKIYIGSIKNIKVTFTGNFSSYVRAYIITDKNYKILAVSKNNAGYNDDYIEIDNPDACWLFSDSSTKSAPDSSIEIEGELKINDAFDPDEFNIDILANKNVLMLGDSLTENKYQKMGISDWFASYTKANVFNTAIGGSQLSARANISNISEVDSSFKAYALLDVSSQATQFAKKDISMMRKAVEWLIENSTDNNSKVLEVMESVDIEKIDIVTIFAGTNDFTSNIWVTDDDSKPNVSLNGAMKSIVECLLTANPNIQIFVFTPIVRWLTNRGVPEYFSDVYKGDHTHYLYEIANKIEELAKLHHLQCCNLYYDMGWNVYNFMNYLPETGSDGTHCSRGYKDIARKMASFIKSNYARKQ